MKLNLSLKLRNLLVGITPKPQWKAEWKHDLADSLKKVQKDLNLNFVAIVARESDYYFELLFLLGTLGLGIGTLLTYLPLPLNQDDILALPLMGFCFGCCLFHFRHFFLQKIAVKAVRNRVSLKAKALFYDHKMNTKSPTLFLYFSEVEKEAVLLYSPELKELINEAQIATVFYNLSINYSLNTPLNSLKPAIEQLGEILKVRVSSPDLEKILKNEGNAPLYFISSNDKTSPFPIPVLKGKKDIN